MTTPLETIDDVGERHLNLQANHEIAYEKQIKSAKTVREVREVTLALVESFEQKGINRNILEALIAVLPLKIFEVTTTDIDCARLIESINTLVNSARAPKGDLVNSPPDSNTVESPPLSVLLSLDQGLHSHSSPPRVLA